MAKQPQKRLTTRDIANATGIKTIGGVIKFLKRENLATKVGGRYRISWKRLAAHYPEILDDL